MRPFIEGYSAIAMKLGGFLKAIASPAVGILFAAVAILSNSQSTRVLVAKHDLFPNQTLQSNDLTLQPMHDLLPGALKSADQESIIGLRVSSRIPAGFPVLKADLAGKAGVGMSLADAIPDADHAIYQLDAGRAHLPKTGVVPGDWVMLSVVLKMDAAQQAALAAAQTSATPTASAVPRPSGDALLTVPPPAQNQAPLILGSQFVTAPVVAVSQPSSSGNALFASDGYIAVLLTLDNHNALSLLQGSGLADITVSLASSDTQQAGRVNTFTELVNVLQSQEKTDVVKSQAPAPSAPPAPTGGTPGGASVPPQGAAPSSPPPAPAPAAPSGTSGSPAPATGTPAQPQLTGGR